MNGIIMAVASVTVIGILCAVMLAAASKVMAVKTDERAERLRAALPGANCGACGFAGCDGYAAALHGGEDVKTNLCLPGGDAVARQLSELLGVAFEDVVERVAVLHCRGDRTVRKDKMEYSGIRSCTAARQLFGGQSACTYGCIGLGDCAQICPTGAIRIAGGIARVDTASCTGCGMCARICPNGVLRTEKDTITTVIGCSNPDKGVAVRKICGRGCIACGKCARECPAQAIAVENNLAVIDYDQCTGCAHCAEICPTGCIRQASFEGIHRQ